METARYPSITEASLTPFRAIEIQLKATPDLLDKSECPYPPLVKAMVRRLVGQAPENDTGSDLVDPASDALDIEIANLYKEIKRDSQAYSGSDMKDKMAMLKTSADLLTRLLTIQEKRFNVRNMAQMQRLVVEMLEAHLTPAQRTEFINRMETIFDV